MKVAFDVSPLQTGHKVRGIGAYTKNLSEELKKIKDIELSAFTQNNIPRDSEIVHYPYFDIFFRTLKLSLRFKNVVTVHDVIPLVFPNHFPSGIRGYINLFFQKKALQKCDAVICDSITSKEDIVSKLQINPKKIHVVYLAPAPRYKKINVNGELLRKKFNLPKEFVLYVGDVNWNKNLDNLLQAIKICKKNLVMVGKALTENIPETQKLLQTVNNIGIKNLIHRLGYVEDGDLVKIYNLSKATVLPSYYEGFGLPVLESMACGTPVVTSKIASISEIAGEDAIFCDPSDPQDIARSINKVFSLSGENLQKLSKNLITHSAKFSWQKTAEETVKIYRSII